MTDTYTSKYDSLLYTLCNITYEFNIFGIRGPRRMKSYIPELDNQTEKPVDIIKKDVNIK
jgi:hypothetical protein